MRKLLKAIAIDEELCNEIDAILWEIKSNNDAIVQCVRENIFNDAVQAYRKDHIMAIGKLELLNRSITNDIVTPAMVDVEDWNWKYENGVIYVWGADNEED